MYTINSRYCVGCQFCRRECPVSAIGIVGPGYQIDPDKCISCGKCVDVCHNNLIYDDSVTPQIDAHAPIELSCELLVVGAGGVGTGAAARASLGGLDVILIEAGKHYGGGTYLAHGAVFPSSKVVYDRLGIEENPEMNVRRWEMSTKGRITHEQLQKNVDYNGEFLDWFDSIDPSFTAGFTKSFGNFPFAIDMPQRHVNKDAEDDSIGPGWMGSWITEKLYETAVKNGARYLNETRARSLIKDSDGKIIGLKATDPGGEITVYAKAIVLGTGCFLMNDEKMNELCPGFVRGDASIVRLNVPTNVGDGHAMAEQAGAKVRYGSIRLRGSTHHPYCYPIYKMLGNPEVVIVNDEGVRFFENPYFEMKPGEMPPPPMDGGDNKDGPPSIGELLLRSRTGKCYSILDSKTLTILGERALANVMPGHDDFLEHWREVIEEECAYESWPARKADTIEELAVKLDMDPAVLKATVERYNELCKKGVDEDFGKNAKHLLPIIEAPFYAFLGQSFENGASMGGVMVDDDFRMVMEDDSTCPNVFLAGDVASADIENGRGPVGLLGGLGGSWASGYRIGCIAEEYIKNT